MLASISAAALSSSRAMRAYLSSRIFCLRLNSSSSIMWRIILSYSWIVIFWIMPLTLPVRICSKICEGKRVASSGTYSLSANFFSSSLSGFSSTSSWLSTSAFYSPSAPTSSTSSSLLAIYSCVEPPTTTFSFFTACFSTGLGQFLSFSLQGNYSSERDRLMGTFLVSFSAAVTKSGNYSWLKSWIRSFITLACKHF